MTTFIVLLFYVGFFVNCNIPPLYDPKIEKIDFVKVIGEKPVLFNKEQFEAFKKQHELDTVIDLSNSYVIQNDEDIHEYFPTGKRRTLISA